MAEHSRSDHQRRADADDEGERPDDGRPAAST
jgi:hypothetical protein